MNDDDASALVDELGRGLPESRPPTSLLTNGRRLRRRRRMLAGSAAVAALLIGGGAATAVGLAVADRPGTTDVAGGSDDEATTAEPCPAVLPQRPDSDGFGSVAPAQANADLPSVQRGWVCKYGVELGEGGGERADVSWHLARSAVALSESDLAGLAGPLSELSPADHIVCNDDLGPRWLLVLADGDDLTGVVVDEFGCQYVRLTDDPARVEPGEGAQPGAFNAPHGLVDRLAAAAAR
jgi:hypothetical protein